MTDTWSQRFGFGVGLLIALVPVVFGAQIVVGGGEWDSTLDRFVWGGIWMVTGISIITGFLVIRRSYGRGMALVIAGVAVFCVTTFWIAFLTVPVGIALVVLAHLRGRGPDLPRGMGTT